jgi:hypothetical protein
MGGESAGLQGIGGDEENMSEQVNGTTRAPADQVWVCGACGKTSRTRYGFDDSNKSVADRGWDESCMMNAVLCWADRGLGDWRAVEEPKLKLVMP